MASIYDRFVLYCSKGELDKVVYVVAITSARELEASSFDQVCRGFVKACNKGHALIVSALATYLDDFLASHSNIVQSAFEQACQRGQANVVNQLLEMDACRKAVSISRNQCACLKVACSGGYSEVLDMLLAQEDMREVTANTLHDCLCIACYHGQLSTVKQLMSLGGSHYVNIHATSGLALYWAVRRNNEDVVRWLLAHEDRPPVQLPTDDPRTLLDIKKEECMSVFYLLEWLQWSRVVCPAQLLADIVAARAHRVSSEHMPVIEQGKLWHLCRPLLFTHHAIRCRNGALLVRLDAAASKMAYNYLAEDQQTWRFAVSLVGTRRLMLGYKAVPWFPYGLNVPYWTGWMLDQLWRSGRDRLPSRSEFDRIKESRCVIDQTYYYEFYEYYNKNQERKTRVLQWRQALCAHRDASLLGRCCAEGRPLELGKRLRLGKLACSAGRLVELDAMAREGGHDECRGAVQLVLWKMHAKIPAHFQ